MRQSIEFESFIRCNPQKLFLMLDGAAIPSLPSVIFSIESAAICLPLYSSTEFSDLIDISPWIVEIQSCSPLLDEFRVKDTFMDSGIILAVPETLKELKFRLNKIMTVLTPSYNEMFFRFYDPRVLDLLQKANEFCLLDSICGQAGSIGWFVERQQNNQHRFFTTYLNAGESNVTII